MSKQTELAQVADTITVDSGNVGIGVLSPASGFLGVSALDVEGPVLARGPVAIHHTNASVFQYNSNTTAIRSYGATANSGEITFTTGGGGTADSERMRIDSSGRVTTPSQPHIHGSPKNSSGSGIADVFYTGYSRNTLSFSNGRVTVPVAGAYLINFNTISDTSTGRVDATILLNGTIILSALSEDNGQGFHQKSLSAVVNLAASDYIQVSNADWYNFGGVGYEYWRTLSITLVG